MKFDVKRMAKFEHNVGEKEKKYRMAGGAALVLISLFTAKIILLVLGVILIATGYSGWCPAYSGMCRSTVEEGEKPTGDNSES